MKRKNMKQSHFVGFGIAVYIMATMFVATNVLFAAGTPETEFLTYSDLEAIEINASIFDVQIVGGGRTSGGNQVEVSVTDIPDGFDVRDTVRRGVATVDIRGRNTWFSRTSGSPRIVVYAPTGIDVKVDTASGNVEIGNIQGVSRIRSASGNVEGHNLGGGVAIRSASGRVSLTDATGTIEITTASGTVELSNSRGIFDVHTASGRILGRSLELTSTFRGESASGDIEITLRNDLRDVAYRLRSVSGRIRFGSTSAEGALRGGNGRFGIEIDTASGSISIDGVR